MTYLKEVSQMNEPIRPMPVTIIDFDMPVWSMMVFMLKLAIAAIPAACIIAFMVAVIGGIFASFATHH
jgi:hypothetical protein